MNITFRYIFSNFNVFYFFIVVLCTARATIYTRGFVGYQGDILSFLFLLVFSVIFIVKNNVRFNKKGFIILSLLYLLWFVSQFLKYDESNLSLSFFLFYQLIVAYSIVYVFGKNLFYLFDAIVTKLSIISCIVWGSYLLFPSVVDLIIAPFSLPIGETGLIKYNIFIASVLNTTADAHVNTWFRNPGFSWEPGMNASIICTAIFINLIINKFRLKKNKNLFYLTIALITSFSTTGYMTFICVILPFYLINISRKWAIRLFIILVPVVVYLFQLDFMGEKLENLQSNSETLSTIEASIEWGDEQGNTYTYVPQRFDGLAFELMNVANDPLVGYGVDVENSFVYSNISNRIALSNGNLKLLAQFGVLFGAILLVFYGYTCHFLSVQYGYKGGFFLLLLFLLLSMSYQFYNLPFYMALMLFPFFKKDCLRYE